MILLQMQLGGAGGGEGTRLSILQKAVQLCCLTGGHVQTLSSIGLIVFCFISTSGTNQTMQ